VAHTWVSSKDYIRWGRRIRIDDGAAGNLVQSPFVVEFDSLARMAEEDRVLVFSERLQALNCVISFRRAVWTIRGVRVVEAVDFLPQNRSLQCAARLASFVTGQTPRQCRSIRHVQRDGKDGVRDHHCFQLLIGESPDSFGLIPLPIIFMFELLRNFRFLKICAIVEPRLSQNRRHMGRSIDVVSNRKIAARVQGGKFFGVPLVHAPEAAELPLDTVVETVMIGIAGYEAVPADAVVCFYPFHYVHGKRQTRDPRLPRRLVREVELS